MLPFSAVQIGSMNLNPGDENKKYLEERRCVVFKTGPVGPSCVTRFFSPPPPDTNPPAIFVFGDSSVDAGTNQYIPGSRFVANFLPYGKDFIPRNGRFSNGKIFVDFIGSFPLSLFLLSLLFKLVPCLSADHFRLAYSPPFLKPNVAFRYGVNFASAASGILDSTKCSDNVGSLLTLI